jgi:hypothetical protein
MKATNSLILGLLGLLAGVVASDDNATTEEIVEPKKLERASLEVDRIPQPVKSKGCKVDFKFAASPGGESQRVKIGKDRFIRITLPQNYNHGIPAPMIFAFHDRNMTAKDMEELTLLSTPAYNKEAIVVYPEPKTDVSCAYRYPIANILTMNRIDGSLTSNHHQVPTTLISSATRLTSSLPASALMKIGYMPLVSALVEE